MLILGKIPLVWVEATWNQKLIISSLDMCAAHAPSVQLLSLGS